MCDMDCFFALVKTVEMSSTKESYSYGGPESYVHIRAGVGRCCGTEAHRDLRGNCGRDRAETGSEQRVGHAEKG